MILNDPMNVIRTMALLAAHRHWGPASEHRVGEDGRQQTLSLAGALALSHFPNVSVSGGGMQVAGAATI